MGLIDKPDLPHRGRSAGSACPTVAARQARPALTRLLDGADSYAAPSGKEARSAPRAPCPASRVDALGVVLTLLAHPARLLQRPYRTDVEALAGVHSLGRRAIEIEVYGHWGMHGLDAFVHELGGTTAAPPQPAVT